MSVYEGRLIGAHYSRAMHTLSERKTCTWGMTGGYMSPSAHTYQLPTVREIGRRSADTVPDWRIRALQITKMDAQRRLILSRPS